LFCACCLGAEFLGEVFADFLGLTDSKYQYVVDAYERHKREVNYKKCTKIHKTTQNPII
jgi:hypothetical protein